jgi:hypothetical protein
MKAAGGETPIAEMVAARLAVYLGPHTARVAVKTFSRKALGREAETLMAADVPQLVGALRPVLRTFIGRVRAELLIEEIVREVGA